LLASVTVTVCGARVIAGAKVREKLPRHSASILAAVAVDAGTMKAVSARRAAARVSGRRQRRGNLAGLGRHGLVLGMLMALLRSSGALPRVWGGRWPNRKRCLLLRGMM
jgi:hypothetical protein